MSKPEARKASGSGGQPLPWNGNQLVAYNLRRARRLRRWTQDQAAEALEPYLGTRWTKATFSAAERSVDTDRVKEFNADELIALSRAFELPLAWFFLPPDPDELISTRKSGKMADAPWLHRVPLEVDALFSMAFELPDEVERRLAQYDFKDKTGRGTLFPDADGRAGEAAEQFAGRYLRTIARQRVQDLDTLVQTLRDLADRLDPVAAQATSELSD